MSLRGLGAKTREHEWDGPYKPWPGHASTSFECEACGRTITYWNEEPPARPHFHPLDYPSAIEANECLGRKP